MFKVTEIVDATGAGVIGKRRQHPFSGISHNSKTIKPGELFVALKGDRFDGHFFLEEAFKRGASAAMVQKGGWKESAAPYPLLFEVKDTRVALGELAHAYRMRFSCPVIGVTGSNGKTTTKDMIAEVLSSEKRTLTTKGNLNNLIGLPFSLFQMGPAHEMAVLEMGVSIPFEVKRLSKILQPTAGIITNIGDAHLETMKSREKIAEAKIDLFRALPKRGVAFVNKDDPYLNAQLNHLRCETLTYSMNDPKVDVYGELIEERGVDGTRLRVTWKEESFNLDVSVPGLHNAMNALAAAAVGLHFGISIPNLVSSLQRFQPTDGRSRIIRLQRGITVIDDCYNANPSSVKAALKLLTEAKSTPGNGSITTYAILGDMRELGAQEVDFHSEIGDSVATQRVDNVLTFGKLSQYIVETAREKNKELKTYWTTDQDKLIEELKRRLSSQSNAVILIKGSNSMGMERVVDSIVDFVGEGG